MCYLDDILIFAGNFDEHNQRLDRVLTAIGDAGLTLNQRKCQFASIHVMYQGYVIDRYGIRPNPKKTAAIREFSRPDNVS